jgi:hypothetical protein
MKPIRDFLTYIALGALVFWLPDVVVHALARSHYSGIDGIFLTVFLPLLTCYVLKLIWKTKGESRNFASAALPAVLGIWVFGPLMMIISATFSGGGFTRPEAWRLLYIGFTLFPIMMIDMSTYDGTLFAVFLVSAALPIMSLFVKQRVQPAPPLLPAK